MSGDSNLYIARVLTFDTVTKDAQVLIPQLQGATPFGAQAYINRYEELEEILDLVAGDRVLVFFDGGDTNSQAYWMVVYAGLEGPPGEPGPPGPPGEGGGEIGDHVAQPDPHTQYQLESAMAAYYTKVEADLAFISPTEQDTKLADYYTQTQVNNELLNYLRKSGGTMSGYIVLHASPILDTHPATKIYVDNHINASNPHPSIQLALGTNTTGNYVATVQGTVNRVSVSGSGTETAAIVLDLPQDIHTTATPQFTRLVLTQASGQPPFTVSSNTVVPLLNASAVQGHDSVYLRDWTNMYNLPDPTITVEVTGAITGTGSKVWTDMSGNVVVSVPTTISTGAGSGLNADLLDGYTSADFFNASNLNAGFVPTARLNGPYSFNLTGALTGNASTATKLATPTTIAGFSFDGSAPINLATLSAGTDMLVATYNGSGASTFNVDSSVATANNKLVKRDATGGIFGQLITADRFKSLVAGTLTTGTPPLEVASTRKVLNLNADLLDDREAAFFANRSEVESLMGDLLYVGLYDAAGYLPENRYIPFDGTTNTITGWNFDPPTNSTVDFRIDCIIPTVVGAANQRPITGNLYFNFSSTAISSSVLMSDATRTTVTTTYPADTTGWKPGVRIHLRAVWNEATDTLTHYWRLAGSDLNPAVDAVPWTQLGTPVTAAGKQISDPSTAMVIGGGSTLYYSGKIYRVTTAVTVSAVTTTVFDLRGSDPTVTVVPCAVTNKVLTGNLATLTVTVVAPATAHRFAIGSPITVTGVDPVGLAVPVFDGSFTVTAATATTVSYTKVSTNVASTAVTGGATVRSTAPVTVAVSPFRPTVPTSTTLTMVGAGMLRPDLRPDPDWATGPTIYRHGMYWVVASSGTLDFIDSDLSGRYEVTDLTAPVANGDWIVAVKNPALGGPPVPGEPLALDQILFQAIPFSAETFVKQQIAGHAGDQGHPHAAAGYLRWVDTDGKYSVLNHNHDPQIAQFIQQHTERTVYSIAQFSVADDPGSTTTNFLTLYLQTSVFNFFRGSEVRLSFPAPYTAYNGVGTVLTITDNVIVVDTPGPIRTLTTVAVDGLGVPLANATAEPHAEYLLGSIAEQTYAKAVHEHNADIAAAILAHTQVLDPHPQYFNKVRGDLAYEVIGAVNAHVGASGVQHRELFYTKAESDGRYSSAVLLADHLKHSDPHPMYLLQDEADALFSNEGHDHDDFYYTKAQTVDLISAATPKNIIATDGAISARIWVGDLTPADPKLGDLWVVSFNVALEKPVMPVNLAATATSATSVRLTWTAWPESAELSSIVVQMSTTGAAASYSDVTPDAAPGAVDYTVSGLVEDTHYWFRVSGVNEVNEGIPEVEWLWGEINLFTQNLSPPPPVGPSVLNITSTGMRLAWAAPAVWPDPGVSGTRYEVAHTGITPVGTAAGTNLFYDFTGLVETTSYQPKVRSIDRSGLRSDWVTATPSSYTTLNVAPPVPPTFPQPTASTLVPTLTGTWTEPVKPHDFFQYEVEVLNDAVRTTSYGTAVTTGATWTTPELPFNTACVMRVRSVDTAGLQSAWTYSTARTTKPDVTLTPTATGGGSTDSYTITWAKPAGTVLDNISGYELVLYKAGVEDDRVTVGAAALSKTWTYLSFGVGYRATLRILRTSGTAPAVGPLTTSINMVADPVPSVTASGSGTTISGTLSAPAAGVPSEFANYQIDLAVRNGAVEATQVPTSVGAYSFTGLDYDTGYSVRVRTIRTGAAPDSSWSAWAQGDTGPHPDSTPPVLPTGLDCYPQGSYGAWYAHMTWPGTTDHARVQIDRSYNGGSWTNMHDGARVTSLSLGTGSADQTMRFRARSADARGNWSGYVYSNTHTLTASPMYVGCTATNSWRPTNGGQYNADGTYRPIQGYYSDPNYSGIGMMYYGNGIRNAVANVTVTSMAVTVVRYNGGGNSQAERIQMALHSEANSPGTVWGWGAPAITHGWWAGNLAWNTSASLNVPDHAEFGSAGTAKGFAFWISGGKPYVVFNSLAQNGFQGFVGINHLG